MNPEIFAKELAKYGFELSDNQKGQFATYYNKLIEFNKKVNLTRITDEDEVYLKHFFDSITPLLEFPDLFKGEKTLCDVGAGAGFPSLPIKILCPNLRITIVDSLGKRLKFLDELVNDLDLDEVTLVHSRAEDAGQNKNLREKFDLVTGRAVARMSVLSEYCLPLTKVNGDLVALKGPKAQDELAEAKHAIEVLGGEVEDVKELTLPDSDDERTLIIVKKVKTTPKKYPRQAGTPNKKPL
ncbi:glucose inhibited division protein b [Lactobacillus taiwanensis DSM 21401]|uniref:16S rRNA (guanine(527)-N(7))-methyltransferase RsmG n=1 Tax=Lactobacillus taiwanensis TaxID=508451 RepID=UPI0006F080ED|nr:16S rRNA (guanine(527)-N(7))-methyltransferase RsmG [Lactobacillus taiwanensis]KRN00043.1 glucose inhibited division protein b [Lactobacillus taiwanensis DSM 21401]MCR1916931.1 16S rRNA (guanine(527)-N(7))-methyltransferase RsmG [Lactobacillus taiwanensis]OYR94706.1 16S rRNA methyltransferase G [Lactobacillus taiwanensis]OYR99796.1 16S rRNA methyltransferase G [Lactobacillus taiwanensis]OYS12888.1 16S rRNA methyltransferase G [Lactobacillus taiwanensis]